MGRLRGPALAAAWLVCAILISAGSAGLVAALDHPPAGGARPELTWAADRRATEALDRVAADLIGLAAATDALGEAGRRALASLPGRDLEQLEAALEDGSATLTIVVALEASARAGLEAVPGVGPGQELALAPAVIERHARLVAGLDDLGELPGAWDGLDDGARIAIELTTLLERHDIEAGEAARLGSQEAYEDALARLSVAEAALAAAEPIRDRLQRTVDTSVLDTWLTRNAAYDTALRDLYEALIDSGGEVTPEVESAAAAELAARNRLPADSRGLVIILAEIGQSGMNQGVIAIEEARGALARALEPVEPPAAD